MISSSIHPFRFKDVKFKIYSSDEIEKISVKEIFNPLSIDQLFNPNRGGLYDPLLGAQKAGQMCEKCGLPYSLPFNSRGSSVCPGHMGHICFPLPLFNPVNFHLMYQLLRSMCFFCCHFLKKKHECMLVAKKLEALNKGLVLTLPDLDATWRRFIAEVKDSFDVTILTKMKEEMDHIIENAQQKSPFQSCSINVKNQESLRKEILKFFFENIPSNCSRCRNVSRKIRHENMSQIFFTSKIKNFLKNIKKDQSQKKANDEGFSTLDRIMLQDIVTQLDAKILLRKLYSKEAPVVSGICGNSLDIDLNLSNIDQSLLIFDTSSKVNLEKTTKEEISENHESEQPSPTDTFFMHSLLIIPSRLRPMTSFKLSMSENPHTMNLKHILSANNDLKTLICSKDKKEEIHKAWFVLQTRVNAHVDQGLCKIFKDNLPGVKQIIEKKQGLLRRHMMGKRVNGAARSVISPDPYIACNQVGIPVEFAKRLFYTEPVLTRNFDRLRRAVINGPQLYPGAFSIEKEDGTVISLLNKTKVERESLANQLLTPPIMQSYFNITNKKVKRHLVNGDVLLLNRQPTLHKPSMQTFKARVLPMEKTLRINYVSCKAFNADFDGDEMNAHLLQGEVARAEGQLISLSDEQYLVPKDGKPIAGLIQDHMVSGVLLTMRGKMFLKQQYQALLMASLGGDCKNGKKYKLLPPCIMKPCCLWSGKQVISSLLLNVIPTNKKPLTFIGKSKVSDQEWRTFTQAIPLEDLSENEVIIRKGELLVGVLDKNHYGATSYGLVHWCYELYGGAVSSQLLTCLGRLFTFFLRSQHSFTMSIDDIIIDSEGEKKRKKKIKEVQKYGLEVLSKALLMKRDEVEKEKVIKGLKKVHFSKRPLDLMELDGAINNQMTQHQDSIKKSCWPQNLLKTFPHNNLQLMVQSGAKGSLVNCMQISCLLGQVDLEGCRPPRMITGSSLPSFAPYDFSPRAGGFIHQRFLTGLLNQEFFFHCMAGRDGLVDTAVKTSRSGYLQRCLIKHLEGLIVAYDQTVRDTDGSIIQFCYGEDGIDVMKSSFLKPQVFKQLIENYSVMLKEEKVKSDKNSGSLDKVQFYQQQVAEWKQKFGENKKLYLEFSKLKLSSNLFYGKEIGSTDEDFKLGNKIWLDEKCNQLKDLFLQLSHKKFKKMVKSLPHYMDPCLSLFGGGKYLGSVSENFKTALDSFVQQIVSFKKLLNGKEKKKFPSQEQIIDLLNLKYQLGLVHPGEAVGVLAATSMGEQTTQMTLNTFHFAGHGAMNVTLGIPRLREILIVASKEIKTPMMLIPFKRVDEDFEESNETISEKEKIIEKKISKVIKKIKKIALQKIINDVFIEELISSHPSKGFVKQYKIRFQLTPYQNFKNEFNLNNSKVLLYLERKFFSHLIRSFERQENNLTSSGLLSTRRIAVNPSDRNKKLENEEEEEGGEEEENSKNIKSESEVMEKTSDQGVKEEESESDSDESMDEDYVKAATIKRKRSDYGEEDEDEEEGDFITNKEIKQENKEEFDEFFNIKKEDEKNLHSPKKLKLETQKDEEESEERKETLDIKVSKEMNNLSHDPKIHERINAMMNKSHVISYSFDSKDNLWAEILFQLSFSHKEMDVRSLVDREIRKTVISQVNGISNAAIKVINSVSSPTFMFEDAEKNKKRNKERKKLQIEGLNIKEMFKYQHYLNIDQLYTNNIQSMTQNYGIEAGVQVIIEEIRQVFKSYGIDVDYRHLSLIADYMTFEGSFKPFNRIGFVSNPSPFHKMSFESSMGFLRQTLLEGSLETLKCPSSCLIVGKPIKTGTGYFDLKVSLHQ